MNALQQTLTRLHAFCRPVPDNPATEGLLTAPSPPLTQVEALASAMSSGRLPRRHLLAAPAPLLAAFLKRSLMALPDPLLPPAAYSLLLPTDSSSPDACDADSVAAALSAVPPQDLAVVLSIFHLVHTALLAVRDERGEGEYSRYLLALAEELAPPLLRAADLKTSVTNAGRAVAVMVSLLDVDAPSCVAASVLAREKKLSESLVMPEVFGATLAKEHEPSKVPPFVDAVFGAVQTTLASPPSAPLLHTLWGLFVPPVVGSGAASGSAGVSLANDVRKARAGMAKAKSWADALKGKSPVVLSLLFVQYLDELATPLIPYEVATAVLSAGGTDHAPLLTRMHPVHQTVLAQLVLLLQSLVASLDAVAGWAKSMVGRKTKARSSRIKARTAELAARVDAETSAYRLATALGSHLFASHRIPIIRQWLTGADNATFSAMASAARNVALPRPQTDSASTLPQTGGALQSACASEPASLSQLDLRDSAPHLESSTSMSLASASSAVRPLSSVRRRNRRLSDAPMSDFLKRRSRDAGMSDDGQQPAMLSVGLPGTQSGPPTPASGLDTPASSMASVPHSPSVASASGASDRSLQRAFSFDDADAGSDSAALSTLLDALAAPDGLDFTTIYLAASSVPLQDTLAAITKVVAAFVGQMEQRWRVRKQFRQPQLGELLGALLVVLDPIVDHRRSTAAATELGSLESWLAMTQLPTHDVALLLLASFDALLRDVARSGAGPTNQALSATSAAVLLARLAGDAAVLACKDKSGLARGLVMAIATFLESVCDALGGAGAQAARARELLAPCLSHLFGALTECLWVCEVRERELNATPSINANFVSRTFQVLHQVWGAVVGAFIDGALGSPAAARAADTLYLYLLSLLEVDALLWTQDLVLEAASQWVLEASTRVGIQLGCQGAAREPWTSSLRDAVLVAVAQMLAFLSDKASSTRLTYPGIHAIDAHVPAALVLLAQRLAEDGPEDEATNVAQLLGEALVDAAMSTGARQLHAVFTASAVLTTPAVLGIVLSHGVTRGLLPLARDRAEATGCVKLLAELIGCGVRLGGRGADLETWARPGAAALLALASRWIDLFVSVPHERLFEETLLLEKMLGKPERRMPASTELAQDVLALAAVLAAWSPAESTVRGTGSRVRRGAAKSGAGLARGARERHYARSASARVVGIVWAERVGGVNEVSLFLTGAYALSDGHALLELASAHAEQCAPSAGYGSNVFLAEARSRCGAAGDSAGLGRLMWMEVVWTAKGIPVARTQLGKARLVAVLQNEAALLVATIDALAALESGGAWDLAHEVLDVLDAVYGDSPKDRHGIALRRTGVYEAMALSGELGHVALPRWGVIYLYTGEDGSEHVLAQLSVGREPCLLATPGPELTASHALWLAAQNWQAGRSLGTMLATATHNGCVGHAVLPLECGVDGMTWMYLAEDVIEVHFSVSGWSAPYVADAPAVWAEVFVASRSVE
ncbi:uncharacterized protein AMSG_06257 [Thecamonas trahens ATCC 50062]|uniref:Rho-GAP domain-containing protein n=1 Tax=Thecamonas trahens ATCC 50062 TaxID=461836 RepID=A0A0L0DC76_THETB|nr:hypothetical protein AMSG_06257 [Thecamonas trahens ATCC 50062]KNC49949.1 hypothetical protein AMSG_06257 [Thecamonas trahens ATCC 50062]|eukprot:XP_013757426.1 hypothetical protein AMSG_06257 [Thecamonas trahens ATCC 50062]